MQRILGVLCLSVVMLPIELGMLMPSDAPAAVARIQFEDAQVSAKVGSAAPGAFKRKKTRLRRRIRRNDQAPAPAAIAIERVRMIRI